MGIVALGGIEGLLPPGAGAVAGRDVPHLLVVVPGVGGSELRRDGRVLWGLSPGVVRGVHRRVGELTEHAPRLDDPDFGDGVTATGLVGLSVPGLSRLLGYGELRRRLHAEFALDDELTYLEFPYDWRRPIAHNAALLATAVGERLRRVRDRLNPRAEVVIVAHSMGGLVSRAYLDAHGGHDVCRRLITLGTPYRGSLKALDVLVNGPKWGLRWGRMAEALGRLPSLYELLPIYPVVVDRGDPGSPLKRAGELLDVLPSLDGGRVKAAREFLLRLNRSEHPGVTEPLAGFGPATLQQAVLEGRALSVSKGSDLLPADYGSAGGDGTVPVISARPIDHTELRLPVRYDNQSHGGLVTDGTSLDALTFAVADALRDHDPVQAPGDAPERAAEAIGAARALTIDVADFHAAGEPVTVPGSARHRPVVRGLWARVDAAGEPLPVAVSEDGSFLLELGPLPEGPHRLDLLDGPDGRAIMSDVVEVG
ncbi:lipase/acyltransferase domain-containing protein [Thermomonospora umbrina]|uniref:Lecithin:cholesterol acyltransferase n=1 Tax=Thermomonospora umbrina TaxID=111806 RepID=A0A3D9SZ89_9ACTN|nr:hypothetical protein [Thermomonospora umbrina]REF01159.1 lecithin:cholesterol acyltransferase [Thermomonospora umbrina]